MSARHKQNHQNQQSCDGALRLGAPGGRHRPGEARGFRSWVGGAHPGPNCSPMRATSAWGLEPRHPNLANVPQKLPPSGVASSLNRGALVCGGASSKRRENTTRTPKTRSLSAGHGALCQSAAQVLQCRGEGKRLSTLGSAAVPSLSGRGAKAWWARTWPTGHH